MIRHTKFALDKWTRIVDDFIGSGLRPTEYCIKTGVNINTLYTWRSRLGRVRELSSPDTGFHELKLTEESSLSAVNRAVSSIDITFGSNIKITLSNDFDEYVLLKIVKVLGKAIC